MRRTGFVVTLCMLFLGAASALAQEIVVANFGTSSVSDIITANGKTATVALTQNPWGVATTKDGSRAYTTRFNGSAVDEIDLSQNPPAVVKTLAFTDVTHSRPAINDADTRLAVGYGTHVVIIDITKNADGSRRDTSLADIDLSQQGLDGDVTSTAYFFDSNTNTDMLGVSTDQGPSSSGGIAFYANPMNPPLSKLQTGARAIQIVFTSDGMAWIGFDGSPDFGNGPTNVISVDPATAGIRFSQNTDLGSISGLASNGALAYAVSNSGNMDTFDSSLNPPVLTDILPLPSGGSGTASPSAIATGSNHIFIVDATFDRVIDIGSGPNPKIISLPAGSAPHGIDVRPKNPTGPSPNIHCAVQRPAQLSTDDFNAKALNCAQWTILQPPPTSTVTVATTNQRLEVSISSGSGGGGIISNCSLAGDFDVQVDYSLLNWPANNLHGFRLNARELQAGINRSSFTPELYVSSVAGFTSTLVTSDSVGQLRLVRSGTLASTFVSNGSTWTLVGSGQVVTGNTRIELDLGTNDVNAPATSAAFDNFKVNAGTVVCPPLF